MKPAILFLIVLIALWATLGVTWIAGDADAYPEKNPHPRYKTMDQSQPAWQGHRGLLTFGWLFGAGQIAIFVGCLALGARRREGLGKFGWGLFAGGLVYLAAFTMMMLAYRNYAQDPDAPFSGPFPAPTAWMLLGVWGAPVLFVVLYVAAFNRWIYTAEDQQRFEQLLAARKPQEGADD